MMYSVSDSGWMESANFLQWFEKMFVPAVRHITPIILFFDGHHSHLTLRLIEVARSNNIHLICFPPPRHAYTPAIRRRSVWSSEIFMAHCFKKVSD